MTPPPPEQRIGHHTCYYMDLKHKKNVDDVRNEMKNAHNSDPVLSLHGLSLGLKNRKKY